MTITKHILLLCFMTGTLLAQEAKVTELFSKDLPPVARKCRKNCPGMAGTRNCGRTNSVVDFDAVVTILPARFQHSLSPTCTRSTSFLGPGMLAGSVAA